MDLVVHTANAVRAPSHLQLAFIPLRDQQENQRSECSGMPSKIVYLCSIRGKLSIKHHGARDEDRAGGIVQHLRVHNGEGGTEQWHQRRRNGRQGSWNLSGLCGANFDLRKAF